MNRRAAALSVASSVARQMYRRGDRVLPVDTIRTGGSFVAGLRGRYETAMGVLPSIALVNALCLRTIARSAKTMQTRCLSKLGYALVPAFTFPRRLPANEFIRRTASRSGASTGTRAGRTTLSECVLVRRQS